jgi:hypothetical protein
VVFDEVQRSGRVLSMAAQRELLGQSQEPRRPLRGVKVPICENGLPLAIRRGKPGLDYVQLDLTGRRLSLGSRWGDRGLRSGQAHQTRRRLSRQVLPGGLGNGIAEVAVASCLDRQPRAREGAEGDPQPRLPSDHRCSCAHAS